MKQRNLSKKIVAFLLAFMVAFSGIMLDASTSEAASVKCKYTLTGDVSKCKCVMTPYQMHGKLKVSGTNIVDKNGDVVMLRGVSLHGIQHTNGSTTAFKDYVNENAFRLLRDEWGVNLIRIPVYTAEGGYCQGNSKDMDQTIQKAVKYATNLGMYVIIDWHILSDGNPKTYQSKAKKFFKKYAKKYKKNHHVLYEICNEPNNVEWKPVKSYATTIIKVIRKYSKDSIILVGTPDWSQLPTYSDSRNASKNPIRQKDIGKKGLGLAKNVMYSIHFYSATHYDNIMQNVKDAHNAGLPIFCTEFSICDASGNGNYDIKNANKWMKLLKQYNISYACWNLSNNNESSAMFKTNCTKLNGWTKKDLTTTGAWYINVTKPLYKSEIAKYDKK